MKRLFFSTMVLLFGLSTMLYAEFNPGNPVEPGYHRVKLVSVPESAASSLLGGGDFLAGATVTFTQTPADGYTFLGWFVDDVEISLPYSVSGNVTVEARYSAVAPQPSQNSLLADCGRDIKLTATAKPGYHFLRWNDDNTSNPRTVSNVTAAASYIAYFAKDTFLITFKNGETVLSSSYFEYQDMPAYTGATPTKASDDQYDYTFSGWTPALALVVANAEYTATFTPNTRQYAVSFLNYNGTLLASSNYDYGATPAYAGAEPTRPATAQYSYTFKGWKAEDNTAYAKDATLPAVAGITSYVADYDSVLNKYVVVFRANGDTLQMDTLEYGSPIVYTGATPTKPSTPQYEYTFSGWSENITGMTVTGGLVLDAVFTESVRKYVITLTAKSLYASDNQYYEIGDAVDFLVNGAPIVATGYDYGTVLSISVALRQGEDCYVFQKWSDGETTLQHTTITLDENNVNLEALFTTLTYEITTQAADESMGTVTVVQL